MPKGDRDKPVVEKPTYSTLEAYKDRVLRVVRSDSDEVVVGKLAVLNEGVAVFHTMRDGVPNVKGVFLEYIKSVQEVPKSALTA